MVERHQLLSAELTRNCLNAGLWELQLYTMEDGKKALYYQGWFTFPLGHTCILGIQKCGILVIIIIFGMMFNIISIFERYY
ncbi:MAG: hypothetical protein K940chlam3_01732 [Chlamydiae bacterium]|nr:hypothetical protein [Chlamydiota bacterium]